MGVEKAQEEDWNWWKLRKEYFDQIVSSGESAHGEGSGEEMDRDEQAGEGKTEDVPSTASTNTESQERSVPHVDSNTDLDDVLGNLDTSKTTEELKQRQSTTANDSTPFNGDLDVLVSGLGDHYDTDRKQIIENIVKPLVIQSIAELIDGDRV